MRITHLCLTAPMTDGWTYQENLLSKYHQMGGNNVSIIASKWVYDNNNSMYKDSREDYYNNDGIHVIRLEIKNRDDIHNRLKRYSGISDALDRTNPEILFIHGCQFLDIAKVSKYLKGHPAIKVFVDNHADFSNSATNVISKFILHGVIWRCCAHKIEPFTEKFYGVLPARVDFLNKVYKLPKNRCELLEMGVDDELVEKSADPCRVEATRERYDIKKDDFLVITGGKIDKAKWQTILLVDAFAELDEKYNAKLIMFGSVINELKSDVEKRCSNRIKFVGWLNPEDTSNLIAAADLAVFPGRHSVLWEQTAGTGIPMICKYWEGTTHVDVGGNVVFLKTDSREEIYDSLTSILENHEEYNQMKNVALCKAKSIFSYREIAKKSIKS